MAYIWLNKDQLNYKNFWFMGGETPWSFSFSFSFSFSYSKIQNQTTEEEEKLFPIK